MNTLFMVILVCVVLLITSSSQSPCLMVPQVIQQAARLHQISDNNCLVVNLAHCLSRLARFHSDIVKDSLTNFILVSYHIRHGHLVLVTTTSGTGPSDNH